MIERAITEGIEVSVESFYIPEQSDPEGELYVFAYRVQLKNFSSKTVQLISRHWIITDSDGEVNEVKGPGVVGEQPILAPGEEYEYMSGSHFKTPLGTMEGTYQMQDDHGTLFDIQIPCFTLALPTVIN